MNDLLDNLTFELKRGTQVLAVLSQLDVPQYGYSLLEILIEQGIEIEANTLYPLLRRLEQQKILDSYWDKSDARPRRFYTINELGKSILVQLTKEWKKITFHMERILSGGQK